MEIKRLVLFTLLMTAIAAGAFYFWGARDLVVEMEGRIQSVTPTADGGVVLHVVEDLPPEEWRYFGEAMVHVDQSTTIWTAQGRESLDPLLFPPGTLVAVETTGFVRESFPVQVDARKLRILKTP